MSRLTLPVLVLTLTLMVSGAKAAPQTEKQIVHQTSTEGTIELIGKAAPEFADLLWVNSKPLTLSALKGKPIFIRFWQGDCTGCEKSMPAINNLFRTYSPKGLVVIGIHTPAGMCSSLITPEKVKVVMEQNSAHFPVALDNNWVTLKKYWAYEPYNHTSASVLIDRNGIVRWAHPGGLLKLPLSLGGEGDGLTFKSFQSAIDQVLNDSRL